VMVVNFLHDWTRTHVTAASHVATAVTS
jgi:hypothetical protein